MSAAISSSAREVKYSRIRELTELAMGMDGVPWLGREMAATPAPPTRTQLPVAHACVAAAISSSAREGKHSRVRERAKVAMTHAPVATGADGLILDAISDVTYLTGQIHRLATAMGREQ